MNLRDLDAFVAVVETGSIVSASTRLHVTQPGVTRRIQNLESTLGAALLDRASKPLRPTAAGRDVYALARQVLRSIDELKTVVAPDAEPAGEFRLGVPPFLSEALLGGPIDRLRERYPKLALRIVSGWSPPMVGQLQAGALDAAVLVAPQGVEAPPGLEAILLGTYDTVVLAPLEADLPSGDAPLDALALHRWVLNQDGCGLRAIVARAFEAAGLSFEVAVEASGTEMQLSLIARGLGVGLAPRSVYAASAWRHRVKVVAVPALRSNLTVLLAYRPDLGRLGGPLELLRTSLVLP